MKTASKAALDAVKHAQRAVAAAEAEADDDGFSVAPAAVSPTQEIDEGRATKDSFVRLHRVGDDGELYYVTKLAPSVATDDYVAKKYGPGVYKAELIGPVGTKGGRGAQRRWEIRVADQPEDPKLTGNPNQENINLQLLQMMMQQMQQSQAMITSTITQSQESHRAMMLLMLRDKDKEPPPPPDPTAMFAQLAGAMSNLMPKDSTTPILLEMIRSNKPEKSNISEMIEGFKVLDALREGRDPDDDGKASGNEFLEGAKQFMPAVGELLKRLPLPQPPGPRPAGPAPTAPTPPALPAAATPEPEPVVDSILVRLDQTVPYLVTKAVQGKDPVFWAGWLVEELPQVHLAALANIIHEATVLDTLVMRYPVIGQHRPWFEQLVGQLRQELPLAEG